jgi:hypothetical protein
MCARLCSGEVFKLFVSSFPNLFSRFSLRKVALTRLDLFRSSRLTLTRLDLVHVHVRAHLVHLVMFRRVSFGSFSYETRLDSISFNGYSVSLSMFVWLLVSLRPFSGLTAVKRRCEKRDTKSSVLSVHSEKRKVK